MHLERTTSPFDVRSNVTQQTPPAQSAGREQPHMPALRSATPASAVIVESPHALHARTKIAKPNERTLDMRATIARFVPAAATRDSAGRADNPRRRGHARSSP